MFVSHPIWLKIKINISINIHITSEYIFVMKSNIDSFVTLINLLCNLITIKKENQVK